MTAWSGFLTESKAFTGYPLGGRMRFWLAFPSALARFWWYTVRDEARRLFIVALR